MKILTFLQRGYWLHLLLLIVLAMQVALSRRAHKTDADIDVMVESGNPQEKVYGLHLKASRGVPRFTRNDVVPMLRSDEPLVRELMMTSNMMRFRNVRVRMNEMGSWTDAALLHSGTSAMTHAQVLARMDELRDMLRRANAVLSDPEATTVQLWERAWHILRMRRLVVREGGTLIILPRQRPLLEYYANSIGHLLPEADRITMTPAAESDATLPRLARRDEVSIKTGSYSVANAPEGTPVVRDRPERH